MIPLPTVFATAVVTKAPARLATAASATAWRGVSARVETEVATEFAVSWKPFVKSNASAVRITTTRSRRALLLARHAGPVLDEDRLEHVGGVLARVDGLLELLVDVLPADDRDRRRARCGTARDGVAQQPVALVLELAQRVELAGSSP